jgi:predicted MPP superfamily phosphohydrolase
MKKLIKWIAAGLVVCMSACSVKNMREPTVKRNEGLTILVATDPHYLSSSLCDNGKQFQETMDAGDGKLTEYSKEIFDRLVEVTLEKKPDALVITGDITFNGELQSLKDVSEKLQKVKEAGIPVLTIPGNHDIDYPFAYRYDGDSVYLTEGITTKNFNQIMGPYGRDEAVSADPDSASYVYALAEDVRMLAIDGNTSDHRGTVSEATMKWMEAQLQKAQEEEVQVIAMSHQNVLKQNQLLYEGFVLGNHEEVETLLRRYGVNLVLSGHSHLQHTAKEDGLTDICTESLAVYPLQYGLVHIGSDRKKFTYENESLGILKAKSLDRFNAVGQKQLGAQLEDVSASNAEKQTMIDFANRINVSFFTGNTAELSEFTKEKGWKLWQKYMPDSFWTEYIASMISQSEEEN